MVVRNFWIEVEIDGRKHLLRGGPRREYGGLVLRVYQRDHGRPLQSFQIVGAVDAPGELLVNVYQRGSEWRKVAGRRTKR